MLFSSSSCFLLDVHFRKRMTVHIFQLWSIILIGNDGNIASVQEKVLKNLKSFFRASAHSGLGISSNRFKWLSYSKGNIIRITWSLGTTWVFEWMGILSISFVDPKFSTIFYFISEFIWTSNDFTMIFLDIGSGILMIYIRHYNLLSLWFSRFS